MKKWILAFLTSIIALFCCGCEMTGNKTTSVSVVYAAAVIFALVVLMAYFLIISKKDKWSILLFCSVFIVNVGYFLLSSTDKLDMALWANRITYFGSVFLPLAMFMIIVRVTNINIYRWVPAVLFALSAVVFFIAASPGYLDIYYKEVSLITVDGATVLQKVYGPLHIIYLFYLLGYFSAMIGAIVYATVRKRVESNSHAIIIALAVFVNIGVWFLGQVVAFDFEFLSVSYIITELFILGLYYTIQENEKHGATVSTQPSPTEEAVVKGFPDEAIETFKNGIYLLTATEKRIYELYTEGKTTRDVMIALDITENTLKYHNRNIYGKLGVSNKKDLVALYKEFSKDEQQ